MPDVNYQEPLLIWRMSLRLQRIWWRISSKTSQDSLYRTYLQISVSHGWGSWEIVPYSFCLKQIAPQSFESQHLPQHERPFTAPAITSTWPKLTFLLCWGHRVIIDTAFLKKIECELCSDMQTIIFLSINYEIYPPTLVFYISENRPSGICSKW